MKGSKLGRMTDSKPKKQKSVEKASTVHTEFVVVFHPGRGLSDAEIREKLTSFKPLGEEIEILVGDEEHDKEPLLVTPLGTFRGKERIINGISAMKSIS